MIFSRSAFLSCLIPVVLVISGSQSTVLAQTWQKLSPDSKLWIDGASNKSDWTVYATDIKGRILDGGNLSGFRMFESVEMTVRASGIVSRKSRIMDRIMLGALKASDFPDIVFESTHVGGSALPDSARLAVSELDMEGNLTLAGVTKPIRLKVTVSKGEGDTYRFTGSKEIVMTDYGIKPPTALFGSLHTKNEVTVNFDLTAEMKE
jgi:YceI-like domain